MVRCTESASEEWAEPSFDNNKQIIISNRPDKNFHSIFVTEIYEEIVWFKELIRINTQKNQQPSVEHYFFRS